MTTKSSLKYFRHSPPQSHAKQWHDHKGGKSDAQMTIMLTLLLLLPSPDLDLGP